MQPKTVYTISSIRVLISMEFLFHSHFLIFIYALICFASKKLFEQLIDFDVIELVKQICRSRQRFVRTLPDIKYCIEFENFMRATI